MPKKPRSPARAAPLAGSFEEIDQSRLAALVGYNLRRAYVHVHQRSADQFRAFGLSAAEFSVLVLVDSNRRVTQRRLCNALAASPPNMVGLLDRLKRRGLIERRRDADDRRTWLLSLTAAGARLVATVERHMLTFEREVLLPGLSPTQIAQLQRLLARVRSTSSGADS